MGRRLAANIALRNPETGTVEVFASGASLPDWAAEQVTNDEVYERVEVEPPPRAGKGSGRDEWAAYAAVLGVEVGDDDSRDDIIAAVDAGSGG